MTTFKAPTFSFPENDSDNDSLIAEVIRLAAQLLDHSKTEQTTPEKREAAQLARLMKDKAGKAFLFAMVDEVFRPNKRGTQAKRWRGLLNEYGLPQYPALQDRAMMQLGAFASRIAPQIVMPLVAARMRHETELVILDGESNSLKSYLQRRHNEGFRINLNHLGEAVLGEEEASRRLEAVLEYLANPDVTYISIKISAIYSQINLLAWNETLAEIKQRLRQLYGAAMPAGKFVNLDMEEYRDLALTIAAFQQVLDEPEFLHLSAGIALQAYLPDSWDAQQKLVEWARKRVARGGAAIKIRLVKGANLAMEQVEAELHCWNQAPYSTKAETDANFRRMLEFGCQPENSAVAHVGAASHNLFDVALALVLRKKLGVTEFIEIEMLEGMANHQARAVRDEATGLLLYAPVVRREDFLSALAYLIRRLDENTAPENFLHDLFALEPGSLAWIRQQSAFVKGWENRHEVSSISRRKVPAFDAGETAHFENEHDSDWTQAETRDALWRSIHQWKVTSVPELPDLDFVLETAKWAQFDWEKLGISGRATILRRVAEVMACERFDSIACMHGEGKKAIPEADGEVSETIDFARYYSRFEVPVGVEAKALGVVVVTPPWNFPYSIPSGGILAALMAGNSVIFKPAPEAVETGYLIAQQLWKAGVPREVLQFFPCDDSKTGRALITDERVAAVILTGSIETARIFQRWRPSLRLFAETSGKNALIITAQADRELAIKDLVKSAFGHAGQKCSAASLAIIEREVYESADFRRQLRDAAASLEVGAATDASSIVTPLVQTPNESLKRALTTLDDGEEWLLEPKQIGDDKCLWSPGIKLGVKVSSWFHQTECFGPVLGLMCADSLEQAIEWQNATKFGLTAGIHSLDTAEIALWRENVAAGNLYINRQITGAIVQRQSFGGWKDSSIGPGAKAGGPNYVFNFCELSDSSHSAEDFEADYIDAWVQYFSLEHDPSGLRSESNILRYRPSRGVILRIDEEDLNLLNRAQFAAEVTNVPLTISIASREPDEEFIARLPKLAKEAEFLRTITTPSDAVLGAAYDAGLNWINAPITASGRTELRFWLREQAISQVRHRYGQISEWQPASRRT